MIQQTINEMSRHAESIQSDARSDVLLEIGENVRQGDIYIVRVSDTLPKSAKPRTNRQLADGNTQGSRHVLEGTAALFDVGPGESTSLVGKSCKSSDLRDYQIGPVFTTPGGCTITHPEHGDRTLTEAGTYAVVFQRSLTADEREERAQD